MRDPENFVAGEEIEVEVAPNAGAVVSIRLSAEEVERLSDVADARGTTLTQTARDAVLALLRDDTHRIPSLPRS